MPEPVLKGKTWTDLAEHTLDLRSALRASNEDKASIRTWCEVQ